MPPAREGERAYFDAIARLLGLLVLACLAAGCAGRSSEPGGTTAVGKPSLPALAGQDAATEVLLPGPETRAVFFDKAVKQDRHYRACMKEAGFEAGSLTPGREMLLLPAADGAPEVKARFGLGVEVDLIGERTDAMVDQLSATDRAKFNRTANAPGPQRTADIGGGQLRYPTKGCLPDSYRAAYGSLRAYEELVPNLQVRRTTAAGQFMRSTSMEEAQRRWATCMRDKGFDVSTLDEAKRLGAETFETEGVRTGRKFERRVAMIGVECARQAGVLREVEAGYRRYLDSLSNEDIRRLSAAFSLMRDG